MIYLYQEKMKDVKPKVSIVLLVYNGENYIKQNIENILN